VSKILEVGALPVKYPRVSAVSMKTIAIPVVRRVRKLPAPLLPKMVELDPPNTAPISAPLPVCKSTTRISPKLTIIWITTTTVITFVNPQQAAEKDSYASLRSIASLQRTA